MERTLIDQLVRKAQLGDREAFSEIVRLLMNKTIALTYKMTGNREAAADLAQDSFLSAWTNIGSFKGESKFESWIYKIASNKTLNFLKREKRYVDSNSSIEIKSEDNPELDYNRQELKKNIMEFMMSLPSEQRLVFELHFYKQMTFDETAQATGKSEGTVKTLYREAVKKLRKTAFNKGWHS